MIFLVLWLGEPKDHEETPDDGNEGFEISISVRNDKVGLWT